MPAEITCARGDTVRVKTGVLVERDEVRGVRGAKDMTTVTAVVSSQEETERGAASGGVAIGRRLVGLWKLASVTFKFLEDGLQGTHLPVVLGRQTSDITQRFILHPFILGQFADDCGNRATVGALHGGAPGDGFVGVGGGGRVVQAVEGTGGMDTARRRGRRGLMMLVMLFRRALCWTQGSRDVERRLWRTQLTGLEGQLVVGGGRVVIRGSRGVIVVGGSGGGDSSHIQSDR